MRQESKRCEDMLSVLTSGTVRGGRSRWGRQYLTCDCEFKGRFVVGNVPQTHTHTQTFVVFNHEPPIFSMPGTQSGTLLVHVQVIAQ